MVVLIISAGAALLLIAAYLHEWRRILRRPRLHVPADLPAHPPLVSLLIPARNEERVIAACVAGALSQSYPALEVIVVDDGSSDRTPAILASFGGDPRLRILHGRPLPSGWVGKCNACQQLGEQARGAWLLFLDADTTPAPDLVAALLSNAEQRQLDLLTILPLLELGSFWERAVLPPFLALIIGLYPIERFDHPATRPEQVLANGQCIFVRRAAYAAIGGHGAVHNEVLEDVRLAQAIRRAGYRVGGGEAPDLLRVRMYTSGSEVAAGLIKNAAAGYRSGGARSAWSALYQIGLAFGPFNLLALGLGLVLQGGGPAAWASLSLGALALLAALSLWGALYRRLYRLSPGYGLIWPLGMLAYLLIAGWGIWRVRSGRGVIWKGRTYNG